MLGPAFFKVTVKESVSMRYALGLVLVLALLVTALRVRAHANLEMSSPSANASLTETPNEIRLWYTEPLEPAFSRITVRDRTGTVVQTAASLVDSQDVHQMVLPLDSLPDGLYTVVWRVISAADGHPTEGSFAFGINDAMTIATIGRPNTPSTPIDESVRSDAVIVRTLNLLAASLALGSIGFWLFVWQATGSQGTRAVLWQKRLMRFGWICLGIASVLLLLLQTSITAEVPFWQTLTHPALIDLLTRSSFGTLWVIRMGVWLMMGLALIFAAWDTRFLWAALGFGALVLLMQSLFSHASATQDMAAVAGEWLHLFATTLWIGGLVAFGMTLLAEHVSSTIKTATLVSYFTNYARVAVAALIVTGFYAAWLHVGSVEALLTTIYGQTLIIKLILFLPVLGLAAINLFWTHRQLQQRNLVWTGILRGLICAEIVLLCGILIAVAFMTSGRPSRGIQTLREIAARPTPTMPEPYFGMEMSNDLMVHVDVVPGVVGQNEFRVSLADHETGEPINDASLIRLRFDNLDKSVGQSELRPTFDDNGAYYVTGANLSTPGPWRLRVNVQRPGQFDIVIDFNVNVQLAPTAPVVNINSRPPLSAQIIVSLLTGVMLLGVGGFLGAWLSEKRRIGGKILAVAAVGVGLVFLISTVSWAQSGTVTISEAYARPAQQGMTGGVYFKIENNTPLVQQLIHATTSVTQNVDVHQTSIENDVATMSGLQTLDITPYSSLEIAPGGLHVMLNDLQQDLELGQTFELNLNFESGLSIPVTVTVREE